MITFTVGSVRFVERVAAVCLHEGHVLAHKADHEDFWALPGGRVELLESSEEALRRELREELGVEVPWERLLWIVESFFTYERQATHEIGFYSLVSLDDHPDLCRLSHWFLCLDNPQLRFEWLPLGSLAQARLLPEFLQVELSRLPETPQHVVRRELG
jgi:ADP-ribose pyrophosphatase YjhB (NUDIX family)